MLYQFKSKLDDFIVSEILHEQPSGSGDVLYVWFEKKGINTMDVIHDLCKQTGLERKNFGIAGLKDKQGITRQRITIYKSALQRIGGVKRFLSKLEKLVKVLEVTRHTTPLQVGSNAGNAFTLRLRAKSSVTAPVKEKIVKELDYMTKNGFPNCFGMQRFGSGLRNYHRAKKIIEDQEHVKQDFEIKFKLQAYPSLQFNDYALSRYQAKQYLLDGDIVVNGYSPVGIQAGVYEAGKIRIMDHSRLKANNAHKAFIYPGEFIQTVNHTPERIATGPMMGYNIILPKQDSPASKLEEKLYTKHQFWMHPVKTCKAYRIYGIRRPLWVYPEGLHYQWIGDDLLLHFSLPTGAYATTLLGFLLREIDPVGYLQNGLTIPQSLGKT